MPVAVRAKSARRAIREARATYAAYSNERGRSVIATRTEKGTSSRSGLGLLTVGLVARKPHANRRFRGVARAAGSRKSLQTRQPRGVAQLVEHRSPKPGVAGSSPAAPAGFNRRNSPSTRNCACLYLSSYIRSEATAALCSSGDCVGRSAEHVARKLEHGRPGAWRQGRPLGRANRPTRSRRSCRARSLSPPGRR